MYFGPAFDFGHNHSHYLPSERGSEGEELLVGGDVLIPRVWIPVGTDQAMVTFSKLARQLINLRCRQIFTPFPFRLLILGQEHTNIVLDSTR